METMNKELVEVYEVKVNGTLSLYGVQAVMWNHKIPQPPEAFTSRQDAIAWLHSMGYGNIL